MRNRQNRHGSVVAFEYFSVEIEARSLFLRYARFKESHRRSKWFGIDATNQRAGFRIPSMLRSLSGGAAQLQPGDGPEARHGGLRHRDRLVD